MSSNAPLATVPAGDHVVRDAQLEEFFVAALASGSFVIVEPWQDFVRMPDNSLELEWQWHVVVGGAMRGYRPQEFMLDMAAPMRGPEALNDLDLLDRRGKVARLLGVGQAPANAGDEPILVESKVIQLPVTVTPQPPPAEFGAPEDPNTFPG